MCKLKRIFFNIALTFSQTLQDIKKNREVLLTHPLWERQNPQHLPPTSEPDKKKIRGRDDVETLERTTSPLPNLPEDLKTKQEKIDSAAQVNGVATQRQTSPKQKFTHFQEPVVNGSATAPVKTDVIPEGLRDPLQIISLIRENSKLGFLYVTPAVDRSSILYNPYNLK